MNAVFLDRDGVINAYPGDRKYVTTLNEFVFIPGSIEGMKRLYDNGFALFVISNQAGVAKGLYTEAFLEKVNRKIRQALQRKRAELSGIYYCTHLPDVQCDCRKPKTGLLKRAIEEWGKSPARTFFIGDSFKDMEAARAYGAKSVLVLSGREKLSNRNDWKFHPDYVFDNLLIASHYLCSHYGSSL